jgi:hypothetical protein
MEPAFAKIGAAAVEVDRQAASERRYTNCRSRLTA